MGPCLSANKGMSLHLMGLREPPPLARPGVQRVQELSDAQLSCRVQGWASALLTSAARRQPCPI